jgi:hypothetical protein
VIGVHNAVAISAGAFHDCLALASPSMACWGYNDYGDLGANLKSGSYPSPHTVVSPPLGRTAAARELAAGTSAGARGSGAATRTRKRDAALA